MIKRNFIISAIAWAVLGLGSANAQKINVEPVDVVKILSFSCAVCYASESQDPVIKQAVEDLGGKYIKAPVVSVMEDSGAMAKTYYASRKFAPGIAAKVNDSFFKATQVMGIQANDMSQAYAWLQQDLFSVLDEKTLNSLMAAADGPEANASFSRALVIAKTAGVNSIPAYVFMRNGRFVASIDPAIAPGGPSVLREAVLKKLVELNTSDKK